MRIYGMLNGEYDYTSAQSNIAEWLLDHLFANLHNTAARTYETAYQLAVDNKYAFNGYLPEWATTGIEDDEDPYEDWRITEFVLVRIHPRGHTGGRTRE